MSTSNTKKVEERKLSLANRNQVASESQQVDPWTTTRLAAVLVFLVIMIGAFLFQRAQAFGLWREFWVSIGQLLITAAVLFALLRPRKTTLAQKSKDKSSPR